MKNNKKKIDVVFILDKSGSMRGSEDYTISSFNEYLEKEKNKKYNTRITTVLFSDDYNYLYKRVLVNDVDNLTYHDYTVGGCTALYDAIGSSINYFEKINTDKVLFIIITDGLENASVEYNKDKIKKLIKKHADWEFIYIGADIDSYSAGGEIGIRHENIANYQKTKSGTSRLFKAVECFECSMMEDNINNNWKDELT